VRDAQRIAGALIASVPTNSDPFWREAPRQILVGALLHGKYCPQWGNLPQIYQLFTVGGKKAIDEMARAPHDPNLKFGWTDPKGRKTATHPAVAAAAENILEMSPQTRSSVFATVSAALSIYADPVLAESVSASDFSLREITRTKDGPITLYLCFEPDERDRLGPHLRIVVSACRSNPGAGRLQALAVEREAPPSSRRVSGPGCDPRDRAGPGLLPRLRG
jgi:type IV secretion system protein VirD4